MIVHNNHEYDTFKWLWYTTKYTWQTTIAFLKIFQNICKWLAFQILTTQFIVRFSNANQKTISAILQNLHNEANYDYS